MTIMQIHIVVGVIVCVERVYHAQHAVGKILCSVQVKAGITAEVQVT